MVSKSSSATDNIGASHAWSLEMILRQTLSEPAGQPESRKKVLLSPDAKALASSPQGLEVWKPNGEDLAAVAIVTGQASQEELRYLKSVSMQLWLVGYELTGALHNRSFNWQRSPRR